MAAEAVASSGELLRRIEAGRDPLTSRESALAISVYALRTRRLVTTPRSGGVWTAVVTDAGRYYLEHGRYQKTPAIALRTEQLTALPAVAAAFGHNVTTDVTS